MAQLTAKMLREQILASRGLRIQKEGAYKRGVITNKALLKDDSGGLKTHLMLYIEAHHRDKIENLIWSDGLDRLSERLEIPRRTISYWRTKFPKNDNN